MLLRPLSTRTMPNEVVKYKNKAKEGVKHNNNANEAAKHKNDANKVSMDQVSKAQHELLH